MSSAVPPFSARPHALYGLLACVRLTAFEQRAADAGRAASYEDKVVLAGLATGAFAQFELLRDRLIEAGADPYEAMRPYQDAISAFHERARPADAMEALTKVYVADSILADLYREAVEKADPGTRAVVHESLADSGHAEILTERLRAAAENDARLASRLGLWARRLVGEALSQAHALAEQNPEVGALFGEEGVAAMFGRIVDRHQARMRAVVLRD
ncbi:ferritin-like domain-containing protein [Actinoallomurus spadix]|uniref:Ferritin-like domain-containing protein n=1 Tax=Actinoallomurus spadix TaxID=79912 RepID=A0ABP3H7W4_9ACTN|nr:ferritin-like fold-containing protein [Actinoallomurus spadix]MCO5988944.1 ferritin-like domain-containing protein [Actinoallomurus spadix]